MTGTWTTHFMDLHVLKYFINQLSATSVILFCRKRENVATSMCAARLHEIARMIKLD